ncbi:GAF domain-containing protein, partial [Candidatus Poribacteria bacterium]|nr:GAF domain-containing protein [Candidatus Poribacteria bacterium]
MQPNAADVQTDVGRDLVRPLLRHLPDVIFRLSRDGTFLEHIPTQGRRVGVFADAIVGLPVEQALPPDQAEETTRLLARALRSGEMQRLDYIVWEGDERHVVEGRVVATGDRDALLMLLDATERRSVVAASETIVETSYALLADDPIESVCDRIAEVLARHLDYPMARVSLWHPTVRGARLDARHGDAEVYKDDLAAAARQAEQTGVAAIDVGLAASVPICHSGEVLGTVSVADDRARRMLPSTLGTLESVAASLVGLRDRARVAVALAEQTRALRVYEDTGRLLLATLDLDEILDALSREVVETGVLRSLMVALVDERSQTIQVVRGLTREADGAIVAGGRGSIGAVYRLDDKNVTAEVARTGEMQVVRGWDDRYDDRYGDPERHARTVAYFIPVMKEGRVLAVLATGSQADQESEMLQRIEDMSGLLAQVAVALDHALLYRQTQTAREEMRAVMIGANCLLWHASVAARETHVDESDQFKWETRAFDVDAAQRFMQLYIADGDTYGSAWYASVVPEYVEPMRARAADALLAGRPGYTQEYRCVDATGATRWLYEDVHIDPVAPGRWNLIGVCTDITARKQVEQMKDEFISTVSHELRTPLTSILGALELVVGGSAGELPEQSLPLLKIARDNGRRLTRLVNDILDIDKIESGRVAFDMQTMELAPLIDTAIEANRPFAAGLDVELVFEGAIPGVEVDVDAGRFAQLMANLISNAVKFSPSHGAVTVTMHERDGWVRVSIADDGPGIPESARDDLFERFTQVDGSTTREHA